MDNIVARSWSINTTPYNIQGTQRCQSKTRYKVQH